MTCLFSMQNTPTDRLLSLFRLLRNPFPDRTMQSHPMYPITVVKSAFIPHSKQRLRFYKYKKIIKQNTNKWSISIKSWVLVE